MNWRRRGPVVGLLTLLAIASACGPGEDVANQLERAERLRGTGELREALVELRGALRREPDSDEINFRIARVLQQQGLIADSLFYYEETRRLDPTRSDAPLALAKLLMFDDAERSRELIEGVLEREPANWLAHVRSSELELVLGRLSPAVEAAERAADLSPETSTTQRQLGVVRQAQIRDRRLRHLAPDPALFRSALEAYQAVIRLREGEPVWRARMLRGRIFASWPGHTEDAASEYRTAIASAESADEPRALATVLGVVAEFARSTGDTVLEREVLERWIEAEPEAIQAWERLARLSQASDQRGGRVLDRLIEIRPTDVDAHTLWARFAVDQGRGEQALAHLWETADAGIDPPRTLAAMTALALRAGHSKEAERALARLEREYPDHPRTLLASAQRAIFEERFSAAAIGLQLLEEQHGGEEAARLLAYTEFRLGNLASARSAVERAVERSQGASIAAERLRAKIEAASRDCTGALHTLRGLERRRKRLLPDDLVIRAHCLYEVGRSQKGRAVLERILSSSAPPIEAILLFANMEGHRDPNRARTLTEAALLRAPRSARLLELITQLDLADGRWTEALARLDDLHPNSARKTARVQLLRGRALAAGRDLAAAKKAVRGALHHDPRLPGAVAALAEIFRREGKLSQVLGPLEQKRSAGLLRSIDLALLGRLHAENGDAQAAREALEEAIASDDAPPEARNDLAYLLAKQGRELDRARELAVAARRELGDDPSAADTLGFVDLESGLPDSALAQFREALRLARSRGGPRAVYHYHLGLALRALDRPKEACAALKDALDVDGNFLDANEAREMRRQLCSEPETSPEPRSNPKHQVRPQPS